MSNSPPDTTPSADNPVFWKDGQQFIRLYYFMPERHLLELIQKDEIKVSVPDYCNDPLEFLAIGEEPTGYSFECGFISFSSQFGSSLMWSHYADSHRGVCLQFDFPISQIGKIHEPTKENVTNFTRSIIKHEPLETKKITDFSALQTNEHIESSQFFSISVTKEEKRVIFVKVNYSPLRPHKGKIAMYASFNGRDISEIGLEPSIYTKSEEWAYEKEWRLYVKLNKALSFHDEAFFATGLTQYITKIIVGTRFSKRHELLGYYVTQAAKKSPNPESKTNLQDCIIDKAEYHPEKYEIVLNY